jgi:hypothetical protein
MKLEMEVVSTTKVPGANGGTYNYVMIAKSDSEANKGTFAGTPNAQLIVNGAVELPHGFGQTVTVSFGEAGEQQPTQRVPSRMRQ